MERVIIPLKNGLMTHDNIFRGCENLKRIDLVEVEVLHETIAALHLEEWRNEMTAEVGSINQILPNTDAGYFDEEEDVVGEKTIVIRDWISRVLRKIIRYKAQHRQLLKEVAVTLRYVVPNSDVFMKNVLPFLELPAHTFDGENGD